jgi:hypothetical protein
MLGPRFRGGGVSPLVSSFGSADAGGCGLEGAFSGAFSSAGFGFCSSFMHKNKSETDFRKWVPYGFLRRVSEAQSGVSIQPGLTWITWGLGLVIGHF